MSDEPSRARPHAEASRRVAQIMRAAEDAAHELRGEAERRADARIAEASRAADLRVGAAEEEAAEILGDAQRRAATLHETAEADAKRLRDDALGESTRIVADARQEAEEVQRIAEVFATQTRETAEQSSKKQLGRARELAAEVLADGTEMSHNLSQLADSLRRNAEVLLRDVTLAHRTMASKLDEAGVDLGESPVPSAPADFGDVPEFVPRTPRTAR